MTARARAIEALRRRLVDGRMPRLEMSAIVLVTGLVGFGVSVGLLAAGVTSMGIRYLVAVGLAYAAFLGLLWCWVERARRGARVDLGDVLDVPDIGVPSFDADVPSFGGGGGFGGGGAARAWDVVPERSAPLTSAVSKSSSLDVDADADVLVLLPVLLVLAVVATAGAVVWTAPALFAELLLDALVVSGLYRSLRDADGNTVLSTALRRTRLPATLLAVTLTATGFAMQHFVTSADSIGDIVHALQR